MTRIAARRLATVAAVVIATGCLSSALTNVSYRYYLWGPDSALRALSSTEVEAADRSLVELERATILLELGRYRMSNEALARAAAVLAEVPEPAGDPTVAGDRRPWLPAPYERLLMDTMAMANHLALQEPEEAVGAADRSLTAADRDECSSCEYAFTRVLAAIVDGEVGRYREGLAALAPLELEGDAGELVARLRARLAAGVAAAEPEGLAPPPVLGPRTLVAILLLGRGPDRGWQKIQVPGGQPMQWPMVLTRGPQAVGFASFETEEPAVSVELTDVEALAAASLEDAGERFARSIASEPVAGRLDLRHWSTLPASLQLLELELEPETERVELVYWSPEGYGIDHEVIEAPPGWTGGRLFLTRRMP